MSKFKLIVLLLAVSFFQGCANLDAVGKFADGADKLSYASDKFYTSELETDRKLAGLTLDLAEPITSTESPWAKATQGENLITEARRNKASVAALAEYALALKNIAVFNDEEAIEKSANKLSKNLLSLNKELDGSFGPKESALAQAITKLANLYTDVNSMAIVRKKGKQAQPYVKTIVDTMVADIERQQQRFSITRLNANIKREKWFNAFKQDYQSGSLTASQKALIAIAAGQLVEDELKEKLSELPAHQFLNQLKETANSCLVAHQAIWDTDLKGDVKELVKFSEDARKLVSTVQDIF